MPTRPLAATSTGSTVPPGAIPSSPQTAGERPPEIQIPERLQGLDAKFGIPKSDGAGCPSGVRQALQGSADVIVPMLLNGGCGYEHNTQSCAPVALRNRL